MATEYNYYEAVKDDVRQFMEDNMESYRCQYDNRDDLEEALNEDMWVADSVTGNGSGSYTFSRYEAEENLCHNIELLGEAMEEFGSDVNVLEKGAEWCDVTIRCYLLSGAISEWLDEMPEDFLNEEEV